MLDGRSKCSVETRCPFARLCSHVYATEALTGTLSLGTHLHPDAPDTSTGRCGLLLILITSELRRPATNCTVLHCTVQHSPSGSRAVSCRSYFFSGRSTSHPAGTSIHMGSPTPSPKHCTPDARQVRKKTHWKHDLELEIKARAVVNIILPLLNRSFERKCPAQGLMRCASLCGAP